MKVSMKALMLLLMISFLITIFTGCTGGSSVKEGYIDDLQEEAAEPSVNIVIPSSTRITASSSMDDSGWSKEKVVDGKRDSEPESLGWSSDESTAHDHSEWLMVDLRRTSYIDRIDIYPRNDKGFVGEHFPVSFTIELSIDKKDWVTVVSDENEEISQSVKSFRIAAQTARYIRVTGIKLRPDSSGNGKYRMQLAEIEAYYDRYYPKAVKKAKPGASYYISSSAGDDANDGLSPEKPWKTLTKASEIDFSKGNKILLKCGDVWENQTLFTHGSGTAQEPITISSYGEGDKPKIKAGLGAGHGIKILNSSGYKITGLEFSHSVSGIMAIVDRTLNNEYLWIEDCYFHDIESPSIKPDLIMPYPELYFASGIAIVCFGDEKTSGKTYYKDITITKSIFDRCDTGIINTMIDMPMTSDGAPCVAHNRFSAESLLNVHISDVKITKSYRSGGIMLYGIKDSVIENAFIDETGYQKGMFWGVAACQISMSENVIVKNSEFTRTYRTNNSPDGEGFDFESGNKNVILYNCYIHDNEGPSILFYGQNEGWRGRNDDIVIDSCILENNGRQGKFDHSKVFKNYEPNTGIIKNNVIRLKFDAQCVSYEPLLYSQTNYVYDFDGEQLSGPGINLVNNDDIAVVYSGEWEVIENTDFNKGNSKYTRSPGASMELGFRGQTLKLLGKKGQDLGKAEVYIDGVLEQTVELKSEIDQHGQVIFEKAGLAPGIHTLKVICKEGKVVIDAFDYFDGLVPPEKTRENLALNANITASSSEEGYGWSLKQVNDGERSSLRPMNYGWSSSSNIDQDHEEWLMFDFGEVKSFDEIHMYVVDLSPSYVVISMGLSFPKDFIVSISNDGKKWEDVVYENDYPIPNKNNQRFVLDSRKSSRYVKITGTKLRKNMNDSTYRMQLAEIEIIKNKN